MANEDFTTYTEVDPEADISKTASTTSLTSISESANSYVYKDFGVNHFSGDLIHEFEFQTSNEVGATWAGTFYALENFLGTGPGSVSNGGDAFRFFKNGNEALYIYLQENGSISSDNTIALAQAVTYFITVVRNDSGGANNTGLYTVYIRTGSHTGTLVDTLTVTSAAGEQNDFRYMYSYQRIQASGSDTSDGFIQNLNLNEAVAVFGAVLQEYFQENFQSIGNN